MKKISVISFMVLIAIAGLLFIFGRSIWYPYYVNVVGQRSVLDVIEKYGVRAETSLAKEFDTAGMAYPPESVSFIAIKDTNALEVWAHIGEKSKLIKTYPIKAASGVLGPKLIEGDRQVPEGIYKILHFNPNSSYHLSMKLDYPNSFDLKHAKKEGRNEPGTNIFIHGKAVSIGCLAMGDPAIEELFTLVHRVGKANVEVIITPVDPSENELVKPIGYGDWVDELYQNITVKINEIRKT
ncbi:murein L,D-transpeptidase family protein [Aliikangiella sp. G2MR2-5]|uniref:L,D-transpeptidase family protein n=1 Tax=Aliikangiella sp. G2MR2-5 TaxID=2788943 RepID=UPI00352E6273